ncbi:MAG: polysaccharide deacetylase family protein, partial [Clostridia bacterium]
MTKKKLLACVLCCLIFVSCLFYSETVSTIAQNRKIPIYCVERADNLVSISFDAAWGADKTRKIMDICDTYNVKATFFLVGFWVDAYPDIVKEIDERGFEIGTHSETHPKMSTLSPTQITSELSTSCNKITAITGKKVKLFRPPFGDYNNTLILNATALDLITIQWSVDSLDWKGLSAEQITTRV